MCTAADPSTVEHHDLIGVLVIHRAVVVNELRLGDWAWMPRGNGNLSLKWIGE